MKTAALLFVALAVGTASAQDEVEAKKKRLGELMKQMTQIQGEAQKLLNELSGGDRTKMDAIMREVMQKYAPEMAAEVGRAQTASNERNASATLKTLATAEADFRANDRDANHVNDFWVGDVSGLYRIDPGDGGIKLIEIAVCCADAKPCQPLDKAGTQHGSKFIAAGVSAPKAGYRYAVVEKYQDDKGAAAKYDEGKGRNPSMFGFCAYPEEYGKTGKSTFMLNENNWVWGKDTGGKPVDVFPADPAKEGWKKLD